MSIQIPPARMMVPRILWGALFVTTVIYLGVLQFMARFGEIPAAPVEPLMPLAFGVVGLVVAAVSVLLPRHMYRQALQELQLEVVTQVDERGGAVLFRDAAPTIRVFKDPAAVVRSVMPRFFTPFILGMALAEAVALFGFTLAMMGLPLLHALPFWAVAWALMIVHFPAVRRILGPLESLYDVVLK